MNIIRQRAFSFYPYLRESNSKYSKKALRRLDKALTRCIGILNKKSDEAKELIRACDYAQTILGYIK